MFMIYCPSCKMQTYATKRRGPPIGRGITCQYWNECEECESRYAAPPPLNERRKVRSYERASKQARLR